MIRGIQDIQAILRYFLSQKILPGDHVLDGTAGRGRDTLFLAECVGKTGRVYSFDIQEAAIAETRKLLQKNFLVPRVTLYLMDHAKISEIITAPLKAAIFNLGYLPGSDHSIVTSPNSTLSALKGTLRLLSPDGILALTVYQGHQGAKEEAKAVNELMSSLPKYYAVLMGSYLNQGDQAPYWILVQKMGRAEK